MPALAWLLALGQPGLVGWTLVALNLAAIVAIPVLSCALARIYCGDARLGLLVLLLPGLMFAYSRPYAEALLIAVVLTAYLLEARGHRGGAIALFAYAILIKEIAVLALIPFVWRGFTRRDPPEVARWLVALVPYGLWACWVRLRVGEFPFLAHDPSRSNALSLPFVGVMNGLRSQTPNTVFAAEVALASIALGLLAARCARGTEIGLAALLFAGLACCVGPNTLAYPGDTQRVLLVGQVVAFAALVPRLRVMLRRRGRSSDAAAMVSAS
jgi:hypothetical protein